MTVDFFLPYRVENEARASGPWSGSLRDPCRSLRWYGVSPDERLLLGRFFGELGRLPDELHTHVGVGRLPDLDGLDVSPEMRRCMGGRWPWRIDACLRFGGSWWLVEVKLLATHQALGQLLFYWWSWNRDVVARRATRAVLLCLDCDPEIAAFADALGVDCVVLG